MPAIINKADARKTVRDASADVAKAGGDSRRCRQEDRSRRIPVKWRNCPEVVEATSRDVARKNAEAAEQNLQKAADDLRGTMGRSAESGQRCR